MKPIYKNGVETVDGWRLEENYRRWRHECGLKQSAVLSLKEGTIVFLNVFVVYTHAHVYVHTHICIFVAVHSLSHVQLFVPPWTVAHQASLTFTNSQSLPKLMSIEMVMPSNHLILCHPLLLLPSIFPSIRVFSTGCVWLSMCNCEYNGTQLCMLRSLSLGYLSTWEIFV